MRCLEQSAGFRLGDLDASDPSIPGAPKRRELGSTPNIRPQATGVFFSLSPNPDTTHSTICNNLEVRRTAQLLSDQAWHGKWKNVFELIFLGGRYYISKQS